MKSLKKIWENLKMAKKKITKKTTKKKVAKKATKKKVAKKVTKKKVAKKATKKKVAKKATKKKVAKKATKKKVAKKAAKKKVTKKAAKKKVAKKVTKKKVAKKATKKKVAKKATKKQNSVKNTAKKSSAKTKTATKSSKTKGAILSKEEALEKYRLSNAEKIATPAVLEVTDKDATSVDDQVELTPLDKVEEVEDGFTVIPANEQDNLTAEYNPDDEQDDPNQGTYGFSWGYNDAFDKPDDEKIDTNPRDEDEVYARGLDKKSETDDAL